MAWIICRGPYDARRPGAGASIGSQVGRNAVSGSTIGGRISHRSARIQALQQLRDVRSSAAASVSVPCRRPFRVGVAPVYQTRFRRTSPTVGRIALAQERQVRAEPLLQTASRIPDRRQVGDSPVSGGYPSTTPARKPPYRQSSKPVFPAGRPRSGLSPRTRQRCAGSGCGRSSALPALKPAESPRPEGDVRP